MSSEIELKIELPKQTIDLNNNELLFISRLFLQQYVISEFITKAFLFLSGLKHFAGNAAGDGAHWYKHKSIKQPFLIDIDVMTELVKNCQFLTEPGEFRPLRKIAGARARHYRLYNASFEEYLMAENYYFAFTETRKDEHLHNLISVLYRPWWQRWDASKIKTRAKRFSTTRPEVANTVLMWYSGVRWCITKRCKTLFSGKPSGSAFDAREYINGLVHQLNNGDITLNEKLLKQPLWSALDELEQRAVAAEKNKG